MFAEPFCVTFLAIMLYPGGENHHCPADKGECQSDNEQRGKIYYRGMHRSCSQQPLQPPSATMIGLKAARWAVAALCRDLRQDRRVGLLDGATGAATMRPPPRPKPVRSRWPRWVKVILVLSLVVIFFKPLAFALVLLVAWL